MRVLLRKGGAAFVPAYRVCTCTIWSAHCNQSACSDLPDVVSSRVMKDTFAPLSVVL